MWANAIDAKKAAESVVAAHKSAMAVETVLAALEAELVTDRDAMVVVDSTRKGLQQREGALKALKEATGRATADDEESADESDCDGDEETEAVLAPNLSAVVDVTRRIDEAKDRTRIEALTWVNDASRWALIARARQAFAKAMDAERKAADRAAKRAANRSQALQNITNLVNHA